jgi:hypothetical protein
VSTAVVPRRRISAAASIFRAVIASTGEVGAADAADEAKQASRARRVMFYEV